MLTDKTEAKPHQYNVKHKKVKDEKKADLFLSLINQDIRTRDFTVPNRGSFNIFNDTNPGGVNSVCPVSHSKYATLRWVFKSRLHRNRAKVLFPQRLGPCINTTGVRFL